MKNKINLILAFVVLAAAFTSCEKDEERVYFSPDDLIPPTLDEVPADLTLLRDNASDTLVFSGSSLDAGFAASAIYYLDACVSGNGFEDFVTLVEDIQPTELKISIADMNEEFLEQDGYGEFLTTATDFRIRGRLLFDSGKGAIGAPGNRVEANSNIVTKDVTLFGLPRIDLVDSGTEQSLASPASDGIYTGFVNLSTSSAFTLFDPETGTAYGGSDGSLVADGAAFVPEADGWHKLMVDLNELEYELTPYSVGIVGAFTEWGTNPDIVMDYDPDKGVWFRDTVDLPTGPMKFRLNSDWALNWGPGIEPDTDFDLPESGEMELLNEWGNINIVTAGLYDIELTINPSDDTKASVVFDLND